MYTTIDFAHPKLAKRRKGSGFGVAVLVGAIALFAANPMRQAVLADDSNVALTLTKSVSSAVVHRAEHVTFTITVVNNGTEAALNVRLRDVLPASLAFTDTGSSERQWTIGTLQAGETRPISYEATVADDASFGEVSSTVTLSADNANDITAETVLTVENPEAPLPATGAGTTALLLFLTGGGVMALAGYGMRQARTLEQAPEPMTTALALRPQAPY